MSFACKRSRKRSQNLQTFPFLFAVEKGKAYFCFIDALNTYEP